MKLENIREGLTFDDVCVLPACSDIYAEDVSLFVRLAPSIGLSIPIISAARESVTEAKMAIALARQGGLGVIHYNMGIDVQAIEVDKVKRCEHGVITDPISITPNDFLSSANEKMAQYRISGVPVIENGKLTGIITNRDLRFETDLTKKVYEVMTKDGLITSHEGTSLEEAKRILAKHKIEKLPLVDEKGVLKGLITIKDIEKAIRYPNASKDSQGRLLAAASIGTSGDFVERAAELVKKKVDMLCIDAPNGHHADVVAAVAAVKQRFGEVPLVAGNVATPEAARALIDAGADCIKVGMGTARNSRTRTQAGIAIPQITAVSDCYDVCRQHGIPVISDGGIRTPGDITKALAAGASAIMMGRIFVGCDESPGRVELYQGRKYKAYKSAEPQPAARNMPQSWEKTEIIHHTESPEGRVPARGPLEETIRQFLSGLRTGFAYAGCLDIKQLHERARFIRISSSTLAEE